MNPSTCLTTLLAIILATGIFGPAKALSQELPSPVETTTDIALKARAATPPVEADDDARKQKAVTDKAGYEEIINSLSDNIALNSYNPALVEAYLGLAGTLEILEQYEEATAVYDQALQTIRISNGLDDLNQLPILERLRAFHEQQENWEEVESYEHLMFHISRRNFDAGDDRHYQALDRLGRWKLRAASEKLVENDREEARDALNLYKNELELLEDSADYPRKPLHLATLLLGEARANLLISEQVFAMPISEFRTTGQQTVTTQRCRMVRLGPDRVTQICETVEMPNLDYYINPSARKFQEINQNRLDIRRSIMDAWETLQISDFPVERDILLQEIQDLTNSYNAFVTDNGL